MSIIKDKIQGALHPTSSSSPPSAAPPEPSTAPPEPAPQPAHAEPEPAHDDPPADPPAAPPEPSSKPTQPSAAQDGTHKAHLLLTACGPSTAAHSQIPLPPNSPHPILINARSMFILVHLRLRSFAGRPHHASRPSSPYFAHPSRTRDRYSIAFAFIPKRDIPAAPCVWGNDFDYPVRRYLPPGFNTAFRIVKGWIDPGLRCDAYADRPWVLGPALSCWFALRVGPRVALPDLEAATPEGAVKEWDGEEEHEAKKWERVELLRRTGRDYAGPPASRAAVKAWLDMFPAAARDGDAVLEEGADGDGAAARAATGMPDGAGARRKFFLKDEARAGMVFEQGRVYAADFHNPYIDFDACQLRLPGFSLNALRFVGDKTHTLRYVFKDQSTGELFFCVTLSLLFDKPYHDLQRAADAEAAAMEEMAATEGEGQ